jgi:hypothetical protein
LLVGIADGQTRLVVRAAGRWRYIALPAAAVAAVVAVTGGPAAAHGSSQPDALFYRTEITGIVPAAANVAARVDQRGTGSS